jgi:hypothetical protein
MLTSNTTSPWRHRSARSDRQTVSSGSIAIDANNGRMKREPTSSRRDSVRTAASAAVMDVSNALTLGMLYSTQRGFAANQSKPTTAQSRLRASVTGRNGENCKRCLSGAERPEATSRLPRPDSRKGTPNAAIQRHGWRRAVAFAGDAR